MSAIDDLNEAAALALHERAAAGMEAMESLLGVAMEMQEMLRGMAMLRVDFVLPAQEEGAEEALTREPPPAGLTATVNLDLAFSVLEHAIRNVEEKGAPISEAIANFYSVAPSAGTDASEGPVIVPGQLPLSPGEAVPAAREAIRAAREKERMERQTERSDERAPRTSTAELATSRLREELANASRTIGEMESISERVSSLSSDIIESPVTMSARPYPLPSGADLQAGGTRQPVSDKPVAGRSLELQPFVPVGRLSSLEESVARAEKASSSLAASAMAYRSEASARTEDVTSALAASTRKESTESSSLSTSAVADYLQTAQTLSHRLSEAAGIVALARDSAQEAMAPALAIYGAAGSGPGEVRLPAGADRLAVYHSEALESFNTIATTAMVQMMQAVPQMAPIQSLPRGVSPASDVVQALSALPERIQEIARATTFNNTFHITVNVKGGSEESEMKELGKKIGEILSEELRRYGGGAR